MYSNFHGGERLRSIEVVVAFGLSRGFGKIFQILILACNTHLMRKIELLALRLFLTSDYSTPYVMIHNGCCSRKIS